MTRLFGTNGIRGIVGETMTASLALDVGRALGSYFPRGRLAIGNDTRMSSPMLKAAVISGLTAAGFMVDDVETAPSPAIQYFVKTHRHVGGVIITASHNPREFNGIKVLDAEGMELPREAELKIEEIYAKRDFPPTTWEGVGSVFRTERCNQEYLQAVLDRVEVESIRKAGLKVVLDCANGVATFVSPYLLRRMGCGIATLNAQPDGAFPGHPPEPREEYLGELKEVVVDAGADLGAVHDGDADRVIFVDERGGYVVGDRSLALLASHEVGRRGGGVVVTPVSSSSCVEDVVRAKGGEVLYTKVGAPLVARTVYERGALFGGEENGGLIFPEHQFCRDGAMGLASVLEIIAGSGRSLSDLLKEIPMYYVRKNAVSCPPALKEGVLNAMTRSYEGRRIETLDGVKVHLEDGWVLIRPSGTEAIVRIFSEARSEDRAARINDDAVSLVTAALEDLAVDE